MSVREKVLHLLEESRCGFKLIGHPRTISAQEAAKVAGSKVEEVAKSLILIGDKQPVVAVVMGDQKLDPKKLKQLKGIKDLRFANPEEVIKYSGCPIGSVPPFGKLMDLPIVVDDSILQVEEVVFAAGTDVESVRMKRVDFLEILGGEVVDLKRE